jgi:hypothetical protein
VTNFPATYPDGSNFLVGDTLLVEKARTEGTIVAVIADEFADWSVSEPGLMVKSAALGLVFVPASRLSDSHLVLVRRAKSRYCWSTDDRKGTGWARGSEARSP